MRPSSPRSAGSARNRSRRRSMERPEPQTFNAPAPAPEWVGRPAPTAPAEMRPTLPPRASLPEVSKTRAAERATSLAANLDRRHRGASAEAILRVAIEDFFHGRIALVSSFGADSAVLLHLVANVD